MRLWAAAKAKALCTDWNMTMFFKVVQNDVNQCLDQIKVLRVPDLVPTDPLEVQVKVCVALRAKLISEVKVNIGKLKVFSLHNIMSRHLKRVIFNDICYQFLCISV